MLITLINDCTLIYIYIHSVIADVVTMRDQAITWLKANYLTNFVPKPKDHDTREIENPPPLVRVISTYKHHIHHL